MKSFGLYAVPLNGFAMFCFVTYYIIYVYVLVREAKHCSIGQNDVNPPKYIKKLYFRLRYSMIHMVVNIGSIV